MFFFVSIVRQTYFPLFYQSCVRKAKIEQMCHFFNIPSVCVDEADLRKCAHVVSTISSYCYCRGLSTKVAHFSYLSPFNVFLLRFTTSRTAMHALVLFHANCKLKNPFL